MGLLKYCGECGARCEDFPTGKYHLETGKPVYYKRCPSGICGHVGVEHAFVDSTIRYTDSQWHGFITTYKYYFSCHKCGFTTDLPKQTEPLPHPMLISASHMVALAKEAAEKGNNGETKI